MNNTQEYFRAKQKKKSRKMMKQTKTIHPNDEYLKYDCHIEG